MNIEIDSGKKERKGKIKQQKEKVRESGIIEGDPEEPWASEETATGVVPVREPIGVWSLGISILVLILILGGGG